MDPGHAEFSRRAFLSQGAAALAASGAAAFGQPARTRAAQGTNDRGALVAVTLDLEMSRNFPTWEETHWDYEKGNLTDDVKQYALAAGRRIKRRGGLLHYFAVGRVLEQPSVDWLEEIADLGHPLGNHTYDHVNVKATTPEQAQFRFRRAPWLVREKNVRQLLYKNIQMTSVALEQRAGIKANGFRTPGGFNNGSLVIGLNVVIVGIKSG